MPNMRSLAYKISHCLSSKHNPELRCVICTGVTLFALVLHFNCTALSQSESSNLFMRIITKIKKLLSLLPFPWLGNGAGKGGGKRGREKGALGPFKPGKRSWERGCAIGGFFVCLQYLPG